MKTYIEYKDYLNIENSWIPKDTANFQYLQALQEIENKEAHIEKYITPSLTWNEIRAQRDNLLKESDWAAFPDANPKPSKEAWHAYRQLLRDIPQTFSTPGAVVWPTKP